MKKSDKPLITRERYSAMILRTTTGTESGLGRSGVATRTIDLVCETARRIFPQKTAPNLSAISGTCERAVTSWLSKKANLSADALANILRSDHGLDFLEAIVGDAKPVWWKQFRRRVQAAQLEAKIQKLEQELNAVRRGSEQ